METLSSQPLHKGKPHWLKTPLPAGDTFFTIKQDLRSRNLSSVCEEAKCPNIGECWNTKTATFMICGDTCTRACRFCHVKTGNPAGLLNPNEPAEVAASAKLMGLKYIVITMVDRDDLPDGGASHVAQVVKNVQKENSGIIVELLAGDFQAISSSLAEVVASRIHVYAHNVETVARLTPRVRDHRASYHQSLRVLEQVKELGLAQSKDFLTKSAIMLGLGEEKAEVIATLRDLRAVGVDLVTIGQYMRPSKKHLSIKEWVHPDIFKALEEEAIALGFKGVASAPLVRSSYKAYDFYRRVVASAGSASL